MNAARPSAPLRGFTLIELVVALAMAIVILALATSMLGRSSRKAQEIREQAALVRQGTLLGNMLMLDIRMAGLGVPDADHIDNAQQFYGGLLVATNTELGLLGDAPRPDANYSTLGYLNANPGGERSRLGWHNENNGSCLPRDGSPDCSTANTSLFFPGESGCDSTTDFNDRVCPWSLKRLRANERFQIISGAGAWVHALFDSPGIQPGDNLSGATGTGPMMADWSTDYPDGTAIWPNVQGNPVPSAVIGMGWVATLDRVFYRTTGTAPDIVLERLQCWGDPNLLDAAFPLAGSNALPANPEAVTNFGGGTHAAAGECTGWERLADNIRSFDLNYFDATGTEVTGIAVAAGKQSVRRVQWRIVLEEDVAGRTVQQDVAGSAALRNVR